MAYLKNKTRFDSYAIENFLTKGLFQIDNEVGSYKFVGFIVVSADYIWGFYGDLCVASRTRQNLASVLLHLYDV